MRQTLPLLLTAALLAGGCGTSGSREESQATAPASAPAIGADERSVEAVEEHLHSLARQKDAARKAGDDDAAERLEQAMQEVERAQEEAFEAETAANSPFDRAVDALPLRKPPLHVEQFLLQENGHELVVRTSRFFCRGSLSDRRAAVRAFYEGAREVMRAHGIEDFVLVVDALRETGEVKPLARAAGDDVTITARGRRPGRCGRRPR